MSDSILNNDLPMRFETDRRYYNVTCYRDIFDDLVVVCDYGSKHTRSAHRKIIKVESRIQAQDAIDRIEKVRYRHGYKRIKGRAVH